MESYTFVDRVGNQICHRYVRNGVHHSEIVKSFPIHLYLRSDKGEHQSIYGEPLYRKTFDKVADAKEFVEKYDGITGMDVYGQTDWTQQFIAEYYPGAPGTMEFDINLFKIASIDLEVAHDAGFPEPDEAIEEIISISFTVFGGKSYAFGCHPKPAMKELENVEYFQCEDEFHMLEVFIGFFREQDIHVFTGWNVYGFDVPYLVNRLNRVFGDKTADELSPFYGFPHIKNTITSTYNKEGVNSFKILGITVLDYIELYRKFHPEKRESYRLDYVGEIEEVGRKIDYSEYGNSLMRLYRGEWHVPATEDPTSLSTKDRWCRIRGILAAEAGRRGLTTTEAKKHAVQAPADIDVMESKDFGADGSDAAILAIFTAVDAHVKSLSYGQFLYYNTVDNDLVEKLDKKLQYIQLGVAIAMLTRSRLSDCMGTVKIWDNLIYHMALQDGLVVPPLNRQSDVEKAGGFVKETVPGRYRWPVTFDLTSLYPSIARLLNMSPETLLSDPMGGVELVDDVLSGALDPREYVGPGTEYPDACFAVNGAIFDKSYEGIIARAMSFVFYERVRYKNLMKDEKKALEKLKEELQQLEKELAN